MAEPSTGAYAPGEPERTTSHPSSDTGAAGEGSGPVAEAARGDRFTILRLHARGGLGQVSLARDEKLQREVALKEIRPDKRDNAHLRQRFLVEAVITGQLEHPGIVPIYDLEQDADGQVRYAMRFVQGRTLGAAIREYHGQPTPLAFRELLQRFVTVCQTIAYAHSQGVIHRDLKPANVLLGDYGETLVVDWGIAKRLSPTAAEPVTPRSGVISADADPLQTTDFQHAFAGEEALTQAGQVLGTPAYMAPEQATALGDIGRPADIYSLGAILYELLTGRPPHQGKNVLELLAAVREGRLIPPTQVCKGVPRPLEAVCLQAMAVDVSRRYPTAGALAGDVQQWLADEPVGAYREPLLARLGRWRRRHRTKLIAVGVLLLTALVVGGVNIVLAGQQMARTQALARVETLREATTPAVPILLPAIDAENPAVVERLRQLWQEELPPGQRRRIGLALLPVDPDLVQPTLKTMLLETDDPPEFLLLREGLAARGDDLREELWTEVRQGTTDSRRFRLLVALAAFDPHSANWPAEAPALARQLLTTNRLQVGVWSPSLAPVRSFLIPALGKIAREGRTTDMGLLAATIFTEYAADQPAEMAELLLDASPEQFAILWPRLSQGESTRALMRQELKKTAPTTATDAVADVLASRQANAAIALLRMGEADDIWSLLRANPQPRLRSFLLHRFAALSADAKVLYQRLLVEPNASVRQALILALGEYASEALPAELRDKGLRMFADDSDPGVHSAIDWLLRRLAHGQAVAKAEKELASAGPQGQRRWYVNKEGHTLAVIPGPVEFARRVNRSSRDPLVREIVQPQQIRYTFAVDTRKVTLGQFRRFLRDHPDPSYPFQQPRTPGDDQEPATLVTWFRAARYCRWLSEQEQMAEDDMCFPEIKAIKEGMKLPQNYLERTGYRLPTDAEWECACRAGTWTSRTYGSADELLRYYAWYAENSRRLPKPVGLLKPNDLGLFDIHGLAYEWCSDVIYFSPGVEERCLRGTSRFEEPERIVTTPVGIHANVPKYLGNECGMRIVRTLPAATAVSEP